MGDFSRDTFDKMKHYVGVRLQQGVPLVDADWNEMEDIRKFELQAFIKWFVGDGVLNDGFRIKAIPHKNGDFVIKGGGGARCLVEGMDVVIDRDIGYQEQNLYKNKDLAKEWNVDVVRPLNPNRNMKDIVYLDVWEREVDSEENPELLLPGTKIETCVRLKREWAVRVAENTTTLSAHPKGHVFYLLASLVWSNTGNIPNFKDERQKIGNDILLDEIIDARGTKGNLGSRLDESLTKRGELHQFVVGNNQVKADAAIEEGKILFSNSGHDHSGENKGAKITSNNITGIISESNIDSTIARDAEVRALFNTTSGHDHDHSGGNNSKKISPLNLLGVSENVTATKLSTLTGGSSSDASALHHHATIPQQNRSYLVPLLPFSIGKSNEFEIFKSSITSNYFNNAKGIIPLNMPHWADLSEIFINIKECSGPQIIVELYKDVNYDLILINSLVANSIGEKRNNLDEVINNNYKYFLFINVILQLNSKVSIGSIKITYTLDKLY